MRKLEDLNQQRQSEAGHGRWQAHLALERGNPTRVLTEQGARGKAERG
jgi:6-phosphogluconate dehydrogenase (decarboxylating)